MVQPQPSVESSPPPVRIVVRLLVGNARQHVVLPLELRTSLSAGEFPSDLHLLSVAVELPGEHIVFGPDDPQTSMARPLALGDGPRAWAVIPLQG